jgi:hypothetical protein
MSYWVFFRWTTRYDPRNSEPMAGDAVSRPSTSLPAWRRSDPKHRPMICVPQDSRRHAFYIAHQAGLRPPSTSKSPLQLNQSSPALICPPEDRRCTPNQDRKLIRDNPKPRRSSFTFAAAIDCNSIRRQTGAAVLAAPAIILYPCGAESRRHSIKTAQIERGRYPWSLIEFGYTECGTSRRDVKSSCVVKGEPESRPATGKYFLRRCDGLNFRRVSLNTFSSTATTFVAILSFSYTVKRMARRKRAGLYPAYVHSLQADGPGSTRRYVRRLLAGLFCSLEHGNVSLTLLRFRVSVAKRTSRPSGEQTVSLSRSGNCIASPFRASAFHAAAGCLLKGAA